MARKTIYCIRHAKSSWKDNSLSDRQRPLNKRGHRNAIDMSVFLAGQIERPDLVISSPAKRAVTTAQYFANELDYPSFDITIDERLYFCGVKGWTNTLKSLPDSLFNILVFGHNPEISQLINLASEHEIDALPTCCIAALSCDLNKWLDFRADDCTLSLLKSPKDSRHLPS